jgi:hypothetical protein
VDTNSIAAALIANLKPEPLENLQEVFSSAEQAQNGGGDKQTDGGIEQQPLDTVS